MSKKRDREMDTAFATEDVASATECTGLMPALPTDPEQDDCSAALYGIHRAKRDGRPGKA